MGIFHNFFHNSVGVDLGTANTLIHIQNHGIVLREPSVIAVDSKTDIPIAVGTAARAMLGRTPSTIRASRPLQHGVVSELREATFMLNEFLKRVSVPKNALRNPEMVIAVPASATSVEKVAIRQLAENAHASKVYMPSEALCAAIGADLPVDQPVGSMIVDIGGGTTEVAVLSLSGIVASESIRIAGDEFDYAIVLYLRNTFGMDVSVMAAEQLKFHLGSAWTTEFDDTYEIYGRSLETGMPSVVTVSRAQIREAIANPIALVIQAIKDTLAKTPPEIAADIADHGMLLVGGGALLQGIDDLILNETGVPVFVQEDPMSCLANGIGKFISDPIYVRARDLSLCPR